MPAWLTIIIGVLSGILAGLGTVTLFWKRVVAPSFNFAVELREVIVVGRELTEELKDIKDPFKILKEIIAQFRTDSGSSLRDVVDRLEQWAVDNRGMIEALSAEAAERSQISTIEREASRMLAQEDRQQIARLVMALDKVDSRLAGAATLARGVAADLEASHTRADQSVSTEPGAAADAAAQTQPPEAT